MNERCVDASVVVKLVLRGEPYREVAGRLIRETVAAGITLIAPPIFPTEVDTVIRRRVHDGRLRQADARRAYAILDRAPVQIRAHRDLRQRARDIAERFRQPPCTTRPTPPWPTCMRASSGRQTRRSLMRLAQGWAS
jgi:predicted nucleic acid-binding protein